MRFEDIVMKTIKKSERSIIIGAGLTLILGLMLAIYPDDSLSLLTKIISIGFMILGVYELVEFFRNSKEERIGSASFAIGVIVFAIGLYIFINDNVLKDIITTVIGLLVCIKSIYKIQLAFSIKGFSSNWKYILVSGLIVLSLGIVMIFYPGETAGLITRIIGIALTVTSIYEITEALFTIKKMDKVVDVKMITDASFIEKDSK